MGFHEKSCVLSAFVGSNPTPRIFLNTFIVLVSRICMEELMLIKAGKNDWKDVLACELACKSPTYAAIDNEKDVKKLLEESEIFFLKLEDNLVGTIIYKIEKDNSAYIDGLTILPSYRGKGLATKAMGLLLNKLKSFSKVTLKVHPENTPAILIYLKTGFKIKKWEDNPFNDGQPRLFLEKIN